MYSKLFLKRTAKCKAGGQQFLMSYPVQMAMPDITNSSDSVVPVTHSFVNFERVNDYNELVFSRWSPNNGFYYFDQC